MRMCLRPLILWLILMLASPCGLAIDAARGIHQLQHSSWTARDGAPDDITVMTQGHDGFLWLGTYSGLVRFDCLRFEPVIARQGRYPDTVVLALKRAHDGGMWVGWQVGGISHVKDGVVRNFGEAQGVRIGTVWGFAIDGAGAVWAAGASGVARYDGVQWQTMGPAQGFMASQDAAAFDGVVGLLRAKDGSLWLNAASGAVQVAAAEVARALREPSYPMRSRTHDAVDGVTGKIGMLWFSRQSVTVWIDPHRPPTTLPAARVEIGAMQERLPADTRDLQLSYNASSLGAPARLRFHYLLDSYDRHWHSAGSLRQAQYTGLGPGSYRCKVMAFNGDGVASPVADLPFRVLPVFYQSWWWRTLCALALLAALHAAFRWRVRRHGAQLRARLEAQQAERERIARELQDTLLQGTQAVILHFHNASMALPAHEPAREAMLRALDVADRMLAEGRDQVHQLRAGDADGEPWPVALRREGEQLAALHGVVFRYFESGKAHALPAAASHEIGRIAGEALHNAFVHARAALVELEVWHARGMLQVDVRDDGSGLPPALVLGGQVAGHWGLPGMRERAAAIGAELVLIKREGGGTHWRLRVRLGWQQRWLQWWRQRWNSGIEDAAP